MKPVLTLLIFLLLLACARQEKPAGELPELVGYNTHIRPIINQKCISCHGGVRKKGGLSFLFPEEMFLPLEDSIPAIIRGDAENSKIMQRILHHDPEERMPQKADPLSSHEIDLIRKWVDQGAHWETHWAFIPPQHPAIPDVDDKENIGNPIDHFIRARLQTQGLRANPVAKKEDLIRRLSLDLTGLPPSISDVQAFVSGSLSYDTLVDRLLQSPRFGERWTAMWLDLARYADTRGYEKDAHRDMWKYRDWLIDAFNADMPFDSFTLRQLAGDLLPGAGPSDLIATAFHRNTMNNDEGGTDNEEFRIAAVIDRVNTTYEVWQGVTMGCVQCHSHPYDPILHEEYYKSFAIFNNTADADRDDQAPTMKVYTHLDQPKADSLKAYLTGVKTRPRPLLPKENLDQMQAYELPIMQELQGAQKRVTRVFERGNFLLKGEVVKAGAPEILQAGKAVEINDRLQFAQWLVSPSNPLTARVMVNRIWAQLFDQGLVTTLEDFGSQGNKPSHPELLDHLAMRFSRDMHWSLKKLIRYLVRSHTYMQSAAVSADQLQKDPGNIWLSHAPRPRLSAEVIRDQALAVSGLLSEKMYGPSVMPYQPEGIWKTVYSNAKWIESKGEDRYRRAIYTYIRRTSPYPSMITFDAPSREFCVNRRIATNTPLQAMVTLNDPVYVEAANHLADLMDQHPGSLEDKIGFGFEKAVFHKISSEALRTLVKLYNEPPPEAGGSIAPMSQVAIAILNLDQFLTKS